MFLVQLLVAGNETTRNMMSGGLVGFAETPGAWASLCGPGVGRPRRGPCPWPSRRCCGGPPRWWPSCARRPGRPSWLAWSCSGRANRSSCSTPRPTGTNRCSAPPPTASIRPAIPIPMWPSGSAPTSASGPSWPGWRAGSFSKSCWPASARSSWPGRWSGPPRRSSPASARPPGLQGPGGLSSAFARPQ